IMGLSLALTGEISFRDGRPQQNNFDSYTVLRMDGAPAETAVHIVEAGPEVPMGGVGEPCLPPVAPALCNAIFAATGKRIRNLPIAGQLKS
ncbi:MAG: xanthine dehydrogenase family protein molybdopterin-binding subunit, partial [Alphaproteobacteria bacterium]|nr:xanthine dehydrogenase family protein molybdopterin-binding subunit [Alphaproteobacteria bacterium]